VAGNLLDDAHAEVGRAAQPGQDFVGVGLQGVPSQNGRGLAVHFVAGGLPAAQVIVVEGGKVVMDEGVGVQHLQRRRQFFHTIRIRSYNQPRGFKAEDGPQALAAGKHAVPHGLMDN